MRYMKINHKKVENIPISDLTSAYYGSVHILMNIAYNGGMHKQFNDVISTLVEIGCDLSCAKVILYHSALAYKSDMNGFRVPMNTTYYTKMRKQYPERDLPTYRRMSDCIETLVFHGYGVFYRGDSRFSDGDGFASVFTMSDKFKGVFNRKSPKVLPIMKKTPPPSEAIQVRSKKDKRGKRDILVGLRGVAPLKRDVGIINKHLSKYEFMCNGTKILPHLHRVFEENLTSYGRFYFPSQNIVSSLRSNITIDGCPVGEWDYSSQHFRITASLKGKELNPSFKPYHIESGLVTEVPVGRQEREIYKLAMMCILNCKGNYDKAFNNAWGQELRGFGGRENHKLIIARLVEHNHCYMDEIRKQDAASLQFLDSCILEFAMLRLVRCGIPFLPYHDSIVGLVSDEKEIVGAMEDGWASVLGENKNSIIKRAF